MWTLTEIEFLLKQNYTPEEICELLEISSDELVDDYSFKIFEIQNKVIERIKEDLGEDDDQDTEDECTIYY